MPIVKHGYRSDDDRATLRAFYDSPGWKRVRAAVLDRDGHRCRWCGEPAKSGGQRLDVVHLDEDGEVGSTLEVIRRKGVQAALDPGLLASGHRGCHSKYSRGLLPVPARR